MSLNMGGLGFTFTAEDRGFRGALKGGVAGFASLGQSAQAFGKYARQSLSGLKTYFEPFGESVMAGMTERARSFTDGLQAGFTAASGSVEHANSEFQDFATTGIRKIGELTGGVTRFALAVGSRALTSGLRGLSGAVQGMASGATTAMRGLTAAPSNLTTGMEAAMQHHAEAARVIGVNYGYLGRELRTFTRQSAGMADSLNISDQAAGQAVRGFREAGAEFRAVGISSAATLARFSAVTGASSDLLRNTLLQSRREFGMNDEQLQTLMHSTVAFGRQSGDVTGALNGLNERMQTLRTAAAQAGVSMDARRLAQYTLGTNRAAAAFFVFSQNADDARQGANQIATSLLGAERQLQGIFAGTQQDLPQLASELGIATGDISRSFELMQSGPDGFMTGLAQMVSAARATGRPMGAAMNNLLQRMSGALGEEGANRMQTFVQQMMAQGTSGVERAMAGVGERQDLRAIAAAHSTGRTTQEEFDRMQERFTMGFRSISRHAIGPFMRDTGAAFSQFNAMLRSTVEQGGPLGQLVERLSLVHQMGALALLPPDVRPFAAAFGSVASSMAPAVTALGSMGFRIGMLANPVALIAVAVGFLAVQFGALFLRTRNAAKAFAILEQRAANFAESAATFVEQLVPTIVRALPLVIGAIGRIVQIAVPMALRIGVALLRGFAQIGVSLVRWAASFDWRGFASTLFSSLSEVMTAGAGLASMARDMAGGLGSVLRAIPVGPMIAGLGAMVASLIPRLGQLLADGFVEAVGFLSDVEFEDTLNPLVDGLASAVGSLFDRMPDVAGSFFGALERGGARMASSSFTSQAMDVLQNYVQRVLGVFVNNVLPAAVGVVERFFAALPGHLRNVGSMVADVLQDLPRRLSEVMESVGRDFGPRIVSIMLRLRSALVGFLMEIPGLVWSAIQRLPGIVAQIGPAVVRAIGAMRDFVLGALEGIRSYLVTQFPQAATVINVVFEGLRNFVTNVASFMQTVLGTAWAAISGAITLLVNQFREAGAVAGEAFGYVRDFVVGVATSVRDAFVTAWRQVGEAASTLWGWLQAGVFQPLRSAWETVVNFMDTHFSGATTAIREAFGSVVGWFEEQVARIRGVFTTISSAISAVNPFASRGTPAAAAGAGAQAAAQAAAAGAQQRMATEEQVAAHSRRLTAGVMADYQRAMQQRGAQSEQVSSNISRGLESEVAAMQRAGQITQAQAESLRSAGRSALTRAATPVSGAPAAVAPALPSFDFGSLSGRGSAATTAAAQGAQVAMQSVATVSQTSATAMAAAFEGARDRVLAAVAAIRGAASGDAGVFATMRSEAAATLDEIGVRTQAALQGLSGVFETMTTGMVASIVALFSTAIVDGITSSFEQGFQSVLMFVRVQWLRSMTEAFARVVTVIRMQFRDMVEQITTVMEVLFRYLNGQMRDLQTVVARLSGVASTIQARIQMATATAGGPVDARAADLGARDANLNDLYNAIMHPDWYEDDYKNLFISKMDALTEAVRSMRPVVQPAGGSTSAADVRRAARGLASPVPGVAEGPVADATGSVIGRR